jgi:hypothetical protein
MLYYASDIEKPSNEPGEQPGIRFNMLLATLILFLNHARSLITEIGVVGPLRLEARINRVLGVPWVESDPVVPSVRTPRDQKLLDDDVEVVLNTSAAHLVGSVDDVLKELFRCIFLATNWPGLARTAEKLQEILNKGYAVSKIENTQPFH